MSVERKRKQKSEIRKRKTKKLEGWTIETGYEVSGEGVVRKGLEILTESILKKIHRKTDVLNALRREKIISDLLYSEKASEEIGEKAQDGEMEVEEDDIERVWIGRKN